MLVVPATKKMMRTRLPVNLFLFLSIKLPQQVNQILFCYCASSNPI